MMCSLIPSAINLQSLHSNLEKNLEMGGSYENKEEIGVELSITCSSTGLMISTLMLSTQIVLNVYYETNILTNICFIIPT